MADFAVTTVTRSGVALPAGAALSDITNTFDNDGKTFLRLTGSTASVTIQINGQKNLPLDNATTNKTLSVGSSDDVMFGPFPSAWFNNLAGKVTFEVTSGTASNLSAVAISVLDEHN